MAQDIEIQIKAKDFASAVLRDVGAAAKLAAEEVNVLGQAAENLALSTAGIAAVIAGVQELAAAISAVQVQAKYAEMNNAEKTVSSVKNIASAVFALAGGWGSVASSIALAGWELIDYIDKQERVRSYDDQAEVKYDERSGKYRKKQWTAYSLEEIKERAENEEATREGEFRWVELSAAELEEHLAFKKWLEEQRNYKPWRNNGGYSGAGLDEIKKILETVIPKGDLSVSTKESLLKDAPLDVAGLIRSYAQQYGVDVELAAAVAKTESAFNQNAVSSVGAVGVMQLMPETAASLGVTDIYDLRQNIEGGIKYLAQNLATFNGDIVKALAAYNAGPQAVKNYNGVPPYSETQNYVSGITAMLGGRNISSDAILQGKVRAQQDAADLGTYLKEKLGQAGGTEYETGKTSAALEIAKLRGRTARIASFDLDTDGLNTQIAQYEQLLNDKVTEKWTKSWQTLKDDTRKAQAEMTGDAAAFADISYRETVGKLDEERKAREKAVMQDKDDAVAKAAVDTWYTEQVALAEQKRSDVHREERLKEYGLSIEHNSLLLQLEGKTQAEVDALNRQALQSKIALLDAEIVKVQENKEKRVALEKEKADAIKELSNASATDMSAALYAYLEELRTQSTNWKTVYGEAFSAIENSVTQNLNGVITRTQSFSTGLTNIFHSMADEIRNTWMKMWYETTIKKPLMGLLGNIFGGIFGGGKGGSGDGGGNFYESQYGIDYYARASGGPVSAGQIYKVGEYGEEWFIPNVAGTVIPNFRLPDFQNTEQPNSNIGQPNITVNIINKTGTDFKTTAKSIMSNPRTMIVQVTADAIQRNEGGLQDLIAAVGGKR